MGHGCWVAGMAADPLLLAALPAIAGFIALPAFAALCRRRATREASQVAAALAEFAAAARRDLKRTHDCQPLDADLSARVQRLRVPEFAALQLAQELPQARAAWNASSSQRPQRMLSRRSALAIT